MLKLNITCFVALFSLTFINQVQAQKWQSGYFYDTKGNKETGSIRLRPGGKGPVKDEAFLEFKQNSKENPFKLSAGDLRSVVIGRDSFVVAAEPQTANWQYAVDFVKVVLDEDVKLYYFRGDGGSGGGGIKPGLEAGLGGGTGGYGGGIGAGISIPIGHGGDGGGGNRVVYYYGENTAVMKELNPLNFVDIMSDIMGDEPDIVDALRENKYSLNNINKLIADFETAKASHNNQ
jgi:hypothetical protein